MNIVILHCLNLESGDRVIPFIIRPCPHIIISQKQYIVKCMQYMI